MVRLFRIIGSSDPERKLNGWDSFGSWWPSVPGYARYRGPTRSSLYLPIRFLHRPRSLQLCLSQPAQKTFLGGVLLAEFPHGGLECSHLALPDRKISQVIRRVIALSYSLSCRFWMCAAI